MSCIEQAGIWKLELYENIGIVLIRNEVGEIVDNVINTGRSFEFTECENLKLNYSVNEAVGDGGKMVYNHSVEFSLFGFSSAYEVLDDLASLYGWIPVIRFRTGEKFLLNSPIVKRDSEYEENNTQVYPLRFGNEVPTIKVLEPFADVPVFWILETGVWQNTDINGNPTRWTADGLWNTI